MTLSSLIVSRIIARGPSRMYRFGRNALGTTDRDRAGDHRLGALAYAILEAIRVILDGGSKVAGTSLLAYGILSALVCLITWRVLFRMARGRPLVEAEAAGWFSVLLGGTRFAAADCPPRSAAGI